MDNEDDFTMVEQTDFPEPPEDAAKEEEEEEEQNKQQMETKALEEPKEKKEEISQALEKKRDFKSSKEILEYIEFQLLNLRKVENVKNIENLLDEMLDDFSIEKIDEKEELKKIFIKDKFSEDSIILKLDDLIDILDDLEYLNEKLNNFTFIEKVNTVYEKLDFHIENVLEELEEEKRKNISDFMEKISIVDTIAADVKTIKNIADKNRISLNTIINDDDILTIDENVTKDNSSKNSKFTTFALGTLAGIIFTSIVFFSGFQYLKSNNINIGNYEIFVSKYNKILN